MGWSAAEKNTPTCRCHILTFDSRSDRFYSKLRLHPTHARQNTIPGSNDCCSTVDGQNIVVVCGPEGDLYATGCFDHAGYLRMPDFSIAECDGHYRKLPKSEDIFMGQ